MTTMDPHTAALQPAMAPLHDTNVPNTLQTYHFSSQGH